MMTEEHVSQELLLNRLKRVEGQIRGIQKMVEDERGCENIIMQLAAARSAIEGIGALMLNNYMKICFRKDNETDAANMNSLARAIAVWGRVRVGDKG
jgi:DNA-binding FrmR family transcriptional regulator